MKLAGISTTLPMFSGVDNIFYNFYLQALSLANLSPLSASAVISPSTECPSEFVMFQCVMILIVPINLNLKKKSQDFALYLASIPRILHPPLVLVPQVPGFLWG